MRIHSIVFLAMMVSTVFCSRSNAQTATTAAPPKMPAAELDKLLAPIALYPDVLLSQILPAATFPVEIVQAARWMRTKPDISKLDAHQWDPSVKALCRYTEILFKMDEDLDWTNALGAAFLAQQQDVMDSIQRLRHQAQAAGALKSTQQQTIVEEKEVIRVVPAQADVVYVPQYNPTIIYVDDDDDDVSVGTAAAASAISFTAGLALGAWLDTDCDWHGHCVAYCRPGYWGGYAHTGAVHYGDAWAAAGPRRAAVVGENGGAYVGPRGAAVWGENGHGAAWRRPTTYGAPSYSGRYSQYNQANFTQNNVNINTGNRNTAISAGNNRNNVSHYGNNGYANSRPGSTARPNSSNNAFSQNNQWDSGRSSDRGYSSRGSSASQYPARGSQASQRPSSGSGSLNYGSGSARPSSSYGGSSGRSSFGDSRGASQTRNYSSRGSSSRGNSGGSRGGGGRSGGGRGGRR